MLYPTQTVMQLSEKRRTMNPSTYYLTKSGKNNPLCNNVYRKFIILNKSISPSICFLHSADPNGHWCGVQRSFGGVNGRMQNIIPRCS